MQRQVVQLRSIRKKDEATRWDQIRPRRTRHHEKSEKKVRKRMRKRRRRRKVGMESWGLRTFVVERKEKRVSIERRQVGEWNYTWREEWPIEVAETEQRVKEKKWKEKEAHWTGRQSMSVVLAEQGCSWRVHP